MRARTITEQAAAADRATGRRAGQLDAEIGARIRAARLSAGLSLEGLSSRVDLSIQQLHKYEMGTNRIAVARLLDLCDALDVDLGTILQSVKAPDNEGLRAQELVTLVTRFSALREQASRKKVLDLVNFLAGFDGEAP